MKPQLLVSAMLLMAMLTGCAIIEEVNHSLQYATKATEYLNEMNRFAQDLPSLAEQAMANPAALEDLQRAFQSAREAIAAFNAQQAPAIAEQLHNQLVTYNEQLSAQIDEYTRQIQDHVIDLEALANAPMLETIRNMTELMSQIEQLGQ